MSLYNLKHSPEYPKRKYAPSGGSVSVHNATEERALGLGWTNAPPPEETPFDLAPEVLDEVQKLEEREIRDAQKPAKRVKAVKE